MKQSAQMTVGDSSLPPHLVSVPASSNVQFSCQLLQRPDGIRAMEVSGRDHQKTLAHWSWGEATLQLHAEGKQLLQVTDGAGLRRKTERNRVTQQRRSNWETSVESLICIKNRPVYFQLWASRSLNKILLLPVMSLRCFHPNKTQIIKTNHVSFHPHCVTMSSLGDGDKQQVAVILQSMTFKQQKKTTQWDEVIQSSETWWKWDGKKTHLMSWHHCLFTRAGSDLFTHSSWKHVHSHSDQQHTKSVGWSSSVT